MGVSGTLIFPTIKPLHAQKSVQQPARRSRRTGRRPARPTRAAARDDGVSGDRKPTALVVGGGWAGFGAAWQLLKLGFEVQLLDASEAPGGLAAGWRTANGRAVEVGIKGFWYHYKNIDALVGELGLDESPFTEFTSSAFWSPSGIQVTAPIFQALPRLPTPLGSFLYTSPYFTSLPMIDRLTALPLVKAMLEFDADEKTFTKYDKMSARELFLRSGVSPLLYSKFLEPVLLALLFVPLEQLSAATALAVLWNYVLAHQPDFDVRWARGSVSERIFGPWVEQMRAKGALVEGGWRITEVVTEGGGQGKPPSRVTGVVAQRVQRNGWRDDEETKVFSADYTVLALGVKALQGVARSSPDLATLDVFRRLNNFEGVSVIAVRLWLDLRLRMANSSNVFGGIDAGVGGTFFDLNKLQDEYKGEAGSVIEVDLYNSAPFMAMSDKQIVQEVKDRYLGQFLPEAKAAKVLDYAVVKVPQGVTKFCPGSYAWMTDTETPIANLMLAGDHIRHGPGSHGARGLSQEKALVTGYFAAAACARDTRMVVPRSSLPLEVEPDEAHISAAKDALRLAKAFGVL